MSAPAARTPRVKICGLRDAEHALAASAAGADFLGLVFVEGVRRQLRPEEGQAVLKEYRARRGAGDAGGPGLVGLFRNQPHAWVRRVVENAGLDLAQLCGDEDLAYAASLGVPVIRQIRVRESDTSESVLTEAHRWLSAGHRVVLDRYDARTPGGAGRTFDWALADGVAGLEGVLLAGGLTPENVPDAVARLRPWGVDVSSGVETNGDKDPIKIRAFIAAARGAW